MPVTKDKKRNKWYARINYVDALGNYKARYSKYYDTKAEAVRAEHELAAEKTTKGITFGFVYREFLKYKANSVSPQTLLTYRTRFKHMAILEDVPIEDLSAKQYDAFKKSLDEQTFTIKSTGEEKHLSTKWKNDVHAMVLMLINYAELMYGISNSVPKRIGGFKDRSVKEEMKTMSEEDFLKFIKIFDDDPVYDAFFRILFYEGLRKGEANGLTWKCVDFKKNTIWIRQTVYLKLKGTMMINEPKTKSSNRMLPMQKSVLESMKRLHSYYQGFDGYSNEWFCFGGIRPLSETTIDNKKNYACDAAGVDRIRIHDFRHSYASNMISKGADVVLVSRSLGHSNIAQTLNTYSHMFKTGLEDMFKKV